MRVTVLDHGGVGQSVWAPDRDGEVADVVLGFDGLARYPLKSQYSGAIAGRCANRIGRGSNSVVLTHTSPDGDQGYPGEVTVTVTYTLSDDDALRIDNRATTTEPTVVNLTNARLHSGVTSA